MNFIAPDTPEAAEFRRRIEAANLRHGSAAICHGCKRQLRSGESTVIGTARRRGHLMVVAGCCRQKLKVLLGFSVWHAAADIPAAWLDAIPPEGSA
jgi:hypothetical protein